MQILITGRGGSGSWQIRAVQIGAALGARVVPNASADDLAWADVLIAVKRIPGDLLHRVRQSGKPWVYDVVDAYPQPEAGRWSEEQARHWVQTLMAGLEPTAVIWPNNAMQDCAPYMRGAVINHHYRPGIKRNPIRETLEVIGYEGAPQYLAEWKPALEKAAAKIGARFVINPTNLADLDVVVAVRGKEHNGWVQRMFKSDVKAANAKGSGTPLICQRHQGYLDTATGGEVWAENSLDLMDGLAYLQPHGIRLGKSLQLSAGRFSILDAAKQYKTLLESLVGQHRKAS